MFMYVSECVYLCLVYILHSISAVATLRYPGELFFFFLLKNLKIYNLQTFQNLRSKASFPKVPFFYSRKNGSIILNC